MNKCESCSIGVVMDSMERQWHIAEGSDNFDSNSYLSLEMFKFCPYCGREIKENEKCTIT